MSCTSTVTFWIEDAVSSIATDVSVADEARLVVLAVTCSIDADSSLIDATSCSVEVATALGLRRGFLERCRHLVQPAERVVERARLDVGAVRHLVGDARDVVGDGADLDRLRGDPLRVERRECGRCPGRLLFRSALP